MAVNFQGKVSDKENEIATAKEDPEWISMTVDEIYTRKFGNTAITSGFISAQGKRKVTPIVFITFSLPLFVVSRSAGAVFKTYAFCRSRVAN
jgi:hypothetical protein